MSAVEVARITRRLVQGRWIAPTDERSESVVRLALLDRIDVGDPKVAILPSSHRVPVDAAGYWRAELPISPAQWRVTVGADESTFTVTAGTGPLHI